MHAVQLWNLSFVGLGKIGNTAVNNLRESDNKFKVLGYDPFAQETNCDAMTADLDLVANNKAHDSADYSVVLSCLPHDSAPSRANGSLISFLISKSWSCRILSARCDVPNKKGKVKVPIISENLWCHNRDIATRNTCVHFVYVARQPKNGHEIRFLWLVQFWNDAAVETVFFENGLVQKMPANSVHVSLSTISTSLAARLGAQHAEHGRRRLIFPNTMRFLLVSNCMNKRELYSGAARRHGTWMVNPLCHDCKSARQVMEAPGSAM